MSTKVKVTPYDGDGWHAVWESTAPRVVRLVQLIVRASGEPSLASVTLLRGDYEVRVQRAGTGCRGGVLAMIGGLAGVYGLDAFYDDADKALIECADAVRRAVRANAPDVAP